MKEEKKIRNLLIIYAVHLRNTLPDAFVALDLFVTWNSKFIAFKLLTDSFFNPSLHSKTFTLLRLRIYVSEKYVLKPETFVSRMPVSWGRTVQWCLMILRNIKKLNDSVITRTDNYFGIIIVYFHGVVHIYCGGKKC